MILANAGWNEFWRPTFISYRRYLLDNCLHRSTHLMQGLVVDLGGKKNRKRGEFRPPAGSLTHWWYVNLANDTDPDTVADAVHTPFADACADCVICTEVLEHLSQPAICVAEAYRLLRPGGCFVASVPFLYPVHGDPDDYQRFTQDGLRRLCGQFSSLQIERMGGYWGTIGMLLELGITYTRSSNLAFRVARRCLASLARILYWLDVRYGNVQPTAWNAFTTGYFLVAIK